MLSESEAGGILKLGSVQLTRLELVHRARRAAAGFSTLGLGQGCCIALCLRNDMPFFEASFAAAMIGAQPVAVNWHSSVEEANYLFQDCAARVIVIHTDLVRRMRDAFPPAATVLVVETPSEIRHAYDLSADECALQPDMIEWTRWRDSFQSVEVHDLQLPRTIIYTSGTTGRPKGVKFAMPTAAQLEQRLEIVRRGFGFLDYLDRPLEIVAVLTGPLYHSAPNAFAMQALLLGATLIIQPRFDASSLLRLIESERVTHLHMVPVMFHRLLQLSDSRRLSYDVSSLRFVVHAAAPCPVSVKRAMIEWWGPIVNEYYGGTETGMVTQCDARDWLDHPGSVGRVIPEAEVRVVDDTGRDRPENQPGEIIARIKNSADFTYHDDPDKRKEVDRFGLIGLGDIGYFDQDGYLYICDRSRDMIISGGVNIYPAEIEAELARMPGVVDSAVFGIPDDEFGEAIHAVIQPMKGRSLDVRKVKAFLSARLARYKVPRTVDFKNKLPREDSGKIFKRKLREPYWKKSGRSI